RGQLLETAHAVKRAGASMLRGGAYKPRTNPYDFQGLGLEALRLLREVREETGLPVVTEVMSSDDISLIADHADMLRSARATCRTLPCCVSSPRLINPSCSSAAPPPVLKNGC